VLKVGARLSRRAARARDALAAQEVCFETPSEFSQRYVLIGPDPMAIRRCFGPAVLAELVGQPEPLSLDCGKGWLAIYRSPSVPPRQLKSFIDQAGRLVGLFLQG